MVKKHLAKVDYSDNICNMIIYILVKTHSTQDCWGSEKERGVEREREREGVCVRVCVRERERVRERESERESNLGIAVGINLGEDALGDRRRGMRRRQAGHCLRLGDLAVLREGGSV